MTKYLACLIFTISSFSVSAQALEGKLLGTWSDSTLVGSSSFNNPYNEIWGIVSNGVEYAILGSTAGTHFIDVSDPSTPREVQLIEGGTNGPVIIHRDFHDHKGFLYAVADEGSQSTLQIMDLSFLPDSVPVIYDSKEFIRRSHNIFIDTDAEIMYSCISDGDDVSFSPLRLFDISDPYNPEVIQSYSFIGSFFLSQVHDAYVRNDTAYLNAGPDGFVVADFSDPLAPVGLASLRPSDYPQSGYNHSGWLSEDGTTYYMADEDHGMDIKVMDVTQLPDLIVIDTIDAGSASPFTIPHNQIVHNGYLYGSYYYDGLQVWDIDDPENVTRVMYYPTSSIPHRNSFEGAWGVYPFLPSGVILVSDMQEGLFIIDDVENLISNVDETLTVDWDIYPNPSQGAFKITVDNSVPIDKMELLSSQGEIIQSLSLDNDLDLSPGMYTVRISNKNGSTTKKLIVVQ